MSTMQIIRVESYFGWGMFRKKRGSRQSFVPSSYFPDLAERHYKFNTPWGDGLDLDKDDKEWFCGYKTIEQFQSWILKEEIQKMHKHGFKVWLIEATDFQVGKDQIIFTKESIIEKKNITELFL